MKYPLFFSYTDLIDVAGVRVAVEARGRCLMALEHDEWWIEGVEPGGIAASGEIPQQAFLKFRHTWFQVLEDIAHEKASVVEFEAEVARTFEQLNETADMEWNDARDQIRRGCAVEDPFVAMKRVEGDVSAFYRVRIYPEFALSASKMDEMIIPATHDKAA